MKYCKKHKEFYPAISKCSWCEANKLVMIDNINRYKNKYCECTKSHFKITDEGVAHKGVLFLRFENENEKLNLLNMGDKEMYEFLNYKWNLYMSLND
jgi:hypothetical protein